MIRVWIAHGDLHISMVLGMWADAHDATVEEREAWGILLADLTKHIAHGLHQSHALSQEESISRIRSAFLESLGDDSREITGGYTE